jgi:hypothetical protein
MVDVMRSNMLLSSNVLLWLQRQSSLWPLALGGALGLGIGAGALWGIGGLVGAAVCLVVLGTACWYARDAEPVLVGVDIASPPQEVSSATVLEPASEPVLPLLEPLEMVELPGGTFWMGARQILMRRPASSMLWRPRSAATLTNSGPRSWTI